MQSRITDCLIYGDKKNTLFDFRDDMKGDCIVNLNNYAIVPLNILFNPFKIIKLYFRWKKDLKSNIEYKKIAKNYKMPKEISAEVKEARK